MKWANEDIIFLKDNYPEKGPKELSLILKRSIDSINLK